MWSRVPAAIEADPLTFGFTTLPTRCHINFLYVLVSIGDVCSLVQVNLEEDLLILGHLWYYIFVGLCH